jgi:hypothetical protein
MGCRPLEMPTDRPAPPPQRQASKQVLCVFRGRIRVFQLGYIIGVELDPELTVPLLNTQVLGLLA